MPELTKEQLREIAFELGLLGQIERQVGELAERKVWCEVGLDRVDKILLELAVKRSRQVLHVLSLIAKTHGQELDYQSLLKEEGAQWS